MMDRVKSLLEKQSAAVELVPYIVMVMVICTVSIQYFTFWKSKNMSNTPYIVLMMMFVMATLAVLHAVHKGLPVLPGIVNVAIALGLMATKYIFGERNFLQPKTKSKE